MLERSLSLDDKYALERTRAYMTGIQALVRLPILQHQRDLAAGLNTAGFISGYRGSPLGGVDQALWSAQTHLDQHNIHFNPGVNEDLAATSVWGSQQVTLFPGARYDGVFGMWYGKGPGVDRSMDAMRHANAFGTSRYGGVLALAGDDHACKSSTLPHQSEHMFIGASIPVLSPANVQEVLDLGIYGWALSRYSGCWVALKAITENMDAGMPVDVDPDRIQIATPEGFDMPDEGLHGRWPSSPLDQERVLNKYRVYAAREFARVNRLNRVVLDSPKARLGIITSGKAYHDVMQALEDLEIDREHAAEIGLRIFKVDMPWPLEPASTHEFARGLEEILVVEEKRSVIEDQLTGQLYNWPVAERPRVVGEYDEHGADLLTNLGELTPAMVARAIASRVSRFYCSESINERLAFLEAKERTLAKPRKKLERTPYFCSGCPHNTSTRVPEGSVALAGIGCHYMARWMDRDTMTFTQMGGEGATWIGQAPFTDNRHVFQNLGDGTYFHSGLLAIRAAIAAKVNITYKILMNDAVAMTGGQPVDGRLSIDMLVQQLRGEGISRIAIVSDQPDDHKQQFTRLDGLSVDHRDRLDEIQRELRDTPGTTILIYHQTCAAEKRRRRKQGLLDDPPLRVFINQAVCEGCGDCSVQSNCLSVLPADTELGRKRAIDQHACNKDYSCLKGFCPSFVSVVGGELSRRESTAGDAEFAALPEPAAAPLERPWNILVTGIGGTGVLTAASVLAMAAHLEGKGCTTLNQTGLAQKFGAVVSHIRVGRQQQDINAVRIAAGDADLLLGCDLVVSDSDDALAKLHHSRSHAVVNDHRAATAGFIRDPDMPFPVEQMKETLIEEIGEEKCHFVNATRLAAALLGDSIAGNLFLLGFAYQKGLIPVGAEAIDVAIGLNNVAVEFNRQAFTWGRRAAADIERVVELADVDSDNHQPLTDLQDIVDWRADYLTGYQNAAYAGHYREFIDRVKEREQALGVDDSLPLTEAVARSLFKLMAYKDEYEVARLYTGGAFERQLKRTFSGDYKLKFHLAPPGLARRDKSTGQLLKREFPQFIITAFKILAKFKGVRGAWYDPFGYSRERKLERTLIPEYRNIVNSMLERLSPQNHDLAVEIARLPMQIRGFGHVKLANIERVNARRDELWQRFQTT